MNLKRYLKKWKDVHKRKRLKNSFIESYVLKRLKRNWSPETISGRLKNFGILISHEAIYQYIYDGKRYLAEYLPRKHKARFKWWQGMNLLIECYKQNRIFVNHIIVGKREP